MLHPNIENERRLLSQRESLLRISEVNREISPGDGMGDKHFVPACRINHRALASTYKKLLIEQGVLVNTKDRRLWSEFFVPRENLKHALEIRARLLRDHCDRIPPRFSRDYDALILSMPFVILAAFISYILPLWGSYIWLAILTSGLTFTLYFECVNRRYRYHNEAQWGISELIWGTAMVAVNVSVWQALL